MGTEKLAALLGRGHSGASFLGRALRSLFRVDEQRIVLGNSEGVLCRVPRAHLDLMCHVYFGGVLLVHCVLSLRYNFLSSVYPIGAHVLASLVHELYVYLAIGEVLDVDYVCVCVVAACQHHA